MEVEVLKEGDTVMLKSGGPEMTVASIEYGFIKKKRALCQWFDGREIKKAVFELHTIAKI